MPGITSMTWDVFDRMVTVTKNGATTTQKYDAFGRRIARIYNTGVFDRELYFHDIAGRVISIQRRGYSPSQPERVLYFAGNRVGAYTDRLGSVRRTSSTINSHYYPYGEEITSTSNDRYKFAELYRDSDTGLDYAMARYYAPAVGRFLTTDPRMAGVRPKSPQSWNLYSYAINNPVNFGDPSGQNLAAPTIPGMCTAEFSYEDCLGLGIIRDGETSGGGGGGFPCFSARPSCRYRTRCVLPSSALSRSVSAKSHRTYTHSTSLTTATTTTPPQAAKC